MEKSELYSQIEKYAVRIGLDDEDETLCGTGTLFPALTGQEMFVLTVAHVASPLKRKMETEGQAICLICKDSIGNLQRINVNNPEKIYIHSKYVDSDENNNKQEFFFDVAIIHITWEAWMDELNGYQLKEGKAGIELSGYGFPESLDEEKDRSQANAFSGLGQFLGSVESCNAKRLAVKYNVDTDRDIPRDSIMKGYSGTGLFFSENQGIYFGGMVSCSRGGNAAGFSLWAMDVDLVCELMSEINIEIGCPVSFQPYKDMVIKDFDSFKTQCIRQWKEISDELLEDNCVIPKRFERQVNSFLPCEGNRKTCAYFWKEKLKELVIMYKVQNVPKEQLEQLVVQLPQPYDNDKVSLEFLCTELKAESILGKMIQNNQFAKDGEYYNNMIMLINGKKGHRNCNAWHSRKDCRNIMTNIAGEYETYSTKEISEIAEHLLSEDEKSARFDIIKGAMIKCNIAAVGTNKLMEILNKETAEAMKRKMDNILEELWEE